MAGEMTEKPCDILPPPGIIFDLVRSQNTHFKIGRRCGCLQAGCPVSWIAKGHKRTMAMSGILIVVVVSWMYMSVKTHPITPTRYMQFNTDKLYKNHF